MLYLLASQASASPFVKGMEGGSNEPTVGNGEFPLLSTSPGATTTGAWLGLARAGWAVSLACPGRFLSQMSGGRMGGGGAGFAQEWQNPLSWKGPCLSGLKPPPGLGSPPAPSSLDGPSCVILQTCLPLSEPGPQEFSLKVSPTGSTPCFQVTKPTHFRVTLSGPRCPVDPFAVPLSEEDKENIQGNSPSRPPPLQLPLGAFPPRYKTLGNSCGGAHTLIKKTTWPTCFPSYSLSGSKSISVARG